MSTPTISWPDILGELAERRDLSRARARSAMSAILAGEATDAQIAAFVLALRMKGETVEELTGLVEGVRAASVPVDLGVESVDSAGTGGDRSGSFNISTTAALIAAGAGVVMAKHGNRSVSSHCGSADVLEALGVRIDLPREAMTALIREEGFGFLLAPAYHPAFRHVGPVRRELGIATVFNFLGPLANPAGARRQALGVSDGRVAGRMAEVLRNLGAVRAYVYHGADGLDELTTTGPSHVVALEDGEIRAFDFDPAEVGLARSTPPDLVGGDAAVNATIVKEILAGVPGPKCDVALLNAGVILAAAGRAGGFGEGLELARRTVASGAAAALLDRVVARSQELAGAAGLD